ncbi:hypothetical protein [Magnaporthe oryzae chrysovirus 1]|uniref:Uncharacterized protein n=1 Tax=Magnaporthe oryzae chrysovirus 1-A TaxID=2847843 RepID=E0D6V4_9VIRU|nr:hypothetical protein [Magnaporthe oryzae chrysovirus 1]BAJ15134.1 hypothetical protein [Magnaporthe oryzae chrysovirus 1-A]
MLMRESGSTGGMDASGHGPARSASTTPGRGWPRQEVGSVDRDGRHGTQVPRTQGSGWSRGSWTHHTASPSAQSRYTTCGNAADAGPNIGTATARRSTDAFADSAYTRGPSHPGDLLPSTSVYKSGQPGPSPPATGRPAPLRTGRMQGQQDESWASRRTMHHTTTTGGANGAGGGHRTQRPPPPRGAGFDTAMGQSVYEPSAELPTETQQSYALSPGSFQGDALAALSTLGKVPALEVAGIVRRGATVLGKLAPPSEDQTYARLYREARDYVGNNTEAEVERPVDRVWAETSEPRLSRTAMARADPDTQWQPGLYLGMPYGPDAARIVAQPLDAREPGHFSNLAPWIVGVLNGTTGAFEGDALRLSARTTPHVDDGWLGAQALTRHDIDVRLAPSNAACTVSVLVGVDYVAGKPVLHHMAVAGYQDARPPLRRLTLALCEALTYHVAVGGVLPVNAVHKRQCSNYTDIMSAEAYSDPPAPNQLGPRVSTNPPEGCLAQLVQVHQYDVQTGVSTGVMSARDVPPSAFYFGGTPNGRNTGYAIMRVEVDGVITHVLTGAVHMKGHPAFLLSGRRRQPCVRDGLYSPGAVCKLFGDGGGGLCMRAEDASGADRELRTVWSDALSNENKTAAVRSRDPLSAASLLIAIAKLNGWQARPAGPHSITADTDRGEVRVFVEFWPTSGPRWLEVVSFDEEVDLGPEGDDGQCDHPSELALDYWLSGLARYMLKDITRNGYLIKGCGKYARNESSPFQAQHTAAPQASCDVVVSAWRVETKIGPAKASYMYNLGVAVCAAGAVVATSNLVDVNAEIRRGAVVGNGNVLAAYDRRTRSEVARADLLAVLKGLSRLAMAGSVRVYSATQAGNDQADVNVLRSDGKSGPSARIMEIGTLVERRGSAADAGADASGAAVSSGVAADTGQPVTLAGADELWATLRRLVR